VGYKRYRGTVDTVETAKLAHRVLTITCLECGRQTNRWAYKISERGIAWGLYRLGSRSGASIARIAIVAWR
jgi:hypothetical protein